MKGIETLLVAELSKPTKAIILETPFEMSGRYDIYIDGRQEALASKGVRPDWQISPREGSWLTDDDIEILRKTISNLEDPNF